MRLAFIVSVVGLVACESGEPTRAETSEAPADSAVVDSAGPLDTRVATETEAPTDVAEVLEDTSQCCPIDDTPSCSFRPGGSEACYTLYDAPPLGWTLGTDANGCPEWQCSSGSPCATGSCLPVEPGPDAFGSD